MSRQSDAHLTLLPFPLSILFFHLFFHSFILSFISFTLFVFIFFFLILFLFFFVCWVSFYTLFVSLSFVVISALLLRSLEIPLQIFVFFSPLKLLYYLHFTINAGGYPC